MKTKSSFRGFSVVTVLIIIFVLAGLGVGGYFAYTNYVAPMLNPYAKLIPEGLKAYDLGKNADGFFVYKKDKELDDLFNQIPATGQQLTMVESAIGYFSSKDQSGAIVVQFSSKDAATLATTTILAQKPKSGSPGIMPTFDAEQKDNIVIVSLGKGLQAFQEPLSENPDIKNIDPKTTDSQLIMYLNHDKSPESTMLLFALANTLASSGPMSMTQPSQNTIVNSAHAQGLINPGDAPSRISQATGGQESARQMILTAFNGFLSFAKDTTIIVRYKNQNLNATITTNLTPKEKLSTSGAVKLIQQMNGTTDIKEIEKTYDAMTSPVNRYKPFIDASLKELTKSLPNSKATFNFEKDTMQFEITMPSSDLQILINQTKTNIDTAPQIARDADRKANLNNIIPAIEIYHSDNNKYPQNSGCLESLTELNQYFMNNTPPKDPSGPQTFGSTTCTSGYYYQIIPNKEYDLWAKMETPTRGNIDVSPDVYATNPDTYKPAMKTETSTTSTGVKMTNTSPANQLSGAYYFISEDISVGISPTDTSDTLAPSGSPSLTTTQQTTPHKVKRVAD